MLQPGARTALPEPSAHGGSAAGPPHGSSRFCPRQGQEEQPSAAAVPPVSRREKL